MEDSDYPLHEFEIRREGRRWSPEEARRKWPVWSYPHEDLPQKLELLDGKIFLSDGQRLTMLGWMLEQLGADAAVRLGDLDVWRAAVADAERAREGEDPILSLGEDPIHDERLPTDASENLDRYLYGDGGPA